MAINGIDALKAIDADHVVRERGFPTSHVRFWSGSGRRLGRLQLGPPMSDGTVTHTITRADMYGGLYEEVAKRGVPIRHGKRLLDVETTASAVVARFADGTEAAGDVVVGADGVHSATRSLIDPSNPAPKSTGLGNTGGFTRVDGLDANPGDYEMIWGKRCFFGYTVAPDGGVWWFANPPLGGLPDRPSGLTPDQVREHLIDLVAGDRSPAARIVASDRGETRISTQYDLTHVPTWHRGRAVIIGDAAHAASPSSGQGASLAVEDAVTLIRCLRDSRDVVTALTLYEQQRRERVERIVEWGSSMNSTKQSGLIGWALRELVLPLIFKRAGDPGKLEEMAWMYHNRIEWDSPVVRLPG